MENPHSSIVAQMPGWSGLSNTRLTLFGDVYRLPPEMEDIAKEVLSFSLNRHLTLFQLFVRQESQEADILTGNALYFRMHDIKDIYFVGGFGTVQWIDVDEYTQAQPDAIVTACTSAELQVTLPVPFIHFQNCFITRP